MNTENKKATNNPKISVIITCYNYLKTFFLKKKKAIKERKQKNCLHHDFVMIHHDLKTNIIHQKCKKCKFKNKYHSSEV